MEFQEAVEELESRSSDRKEPSLDSTREALEALERPDRDYSVVLVGGTNGKGSTVEMVSEGLKELRYDVGVYKSPHLVTARERVQVNGEMISKEDFLELYREIENLDLEKDLTFFEFMTILAFLCFSEKDIDYAVMEVGMGGRLDATNAADPDISVITNIDEDHTEYLGNTRNEIAEEKAGIIPENGKAVVGDRLEPILETAEERKSEVIEPQTVEEVGGSYIFRDQQFSIPVQGGFQKDNLEAALRAMEEIESIPEDLEVAFEDLECPGRMEVIDRMPKYIHDGAHNPAALRKIIPDLPEDFICVFNALENKDIEEMVQVLEKKASKFYLTKSEFFLAEEPENIQNYLPKHSAEVVRDPEEAVERALEEADEDQAVVVTGSLYLIGDIKKARGE